MNQKVLKSQPKAVQIVFDKVKKHCQNNSTSCLIYIDGLDDAKGQEISEANCELFNSSKKEKKIPNFIFHHGI